jgi:hypothetical protein
MILFIAQNEISGRHCYYVEVKDLHSGYKTDKNKIFQKSHQEVVLGYELRFVWLQILFSNQSFLLLPNALLKRNNAMVLSHLLDA